MHDIKSQFLDLIALYQELENDVSRIMRIDDSGDPQALVQSVLQNENCLARIAQMSSRVDQVSDGWKKCRVHLDGKTREETQQLANAARSQAARLQELFGFHAERICALRSRLEKDLAEIGKGAQYLKVLKPAKNNYPKFIDSLH